MVDRQAVDATARHADARLRKHFAAIRRRHGCAAFSGTIECAIAVARIIVLLIALQVVPAREDHPAEAVDDRIE
jgi:hypothetical protein